MSTALIMVLDTAIECEAHDQHEMRPSGASGAEHRSQMEDKTRVDWIRKNRES